MNDNFLARSTFLTIAAYNEGKVIGGVIDEVKKQGFKNIIVVDDGSTDDTFKKAQSKDVIVLRHILNRGKGAAVKTGIEAALRLGADYLVTIDGDGQHDSSDAKKMVKLLNQGYQIVLGNRFNGKNKIPAFKKFANFFADFFVFLLTGVWVKDTQSGFRAFKSEVFKKINLEHDRYEFESEIIYKMIYHRLKFTEIPIKVRYTPYSQQKAQKQNLVNGIKTLIKILLK
jgi:glycosyltransferase involved in cell wall biosynthesis